MFLSLLCLTKAHNRTTSAFAAAKVIEVRAEEQLEDYITEIDILAECRHANIISLLDAIFFEGWLWVSRFTMTTITTKMKSVKSKINTHQQSNTSIQHQCQQFKFNHKERLLGLPAPSSSAVFINTLGLTVMELYVHCDSLVDPVPDSHRVLPRWSIR